MTTLNRWSALEQRRSLLCCGPANLRPVQGLSILVIAILAVAACDGSSSKADEVTVYKIQNRWNQFIYDAGAKVGYHKAGDDAKHRWVLEETPKGQRIKNLATGAYLAVAKDASRSETHPTRRPGRAGYHQASGRWMLCPGPWLSIKSPVSPAST